VDCQIALTFDVWCITAPRRL